MPKTKSPYYWVADPLLEHPTLVEKPMFGCDAFYLHGRLKLVLCPGKEEPWRGILVPTFKEFHQALIKEMPGLEPHSVLGKWLYISEAADSFEDVGEKIAQLILRDDPRLGVEPDEKKKRPKKKQTKKKVGSKK